MSKKNREIGLLVIAGCMHSGKTDELIRETHVQSAYAHRQVQAFSPKVDTRSGEGKIASKAGKSYPAETVAHDRPRDILKLVRDGTELVAIDEVQFFEPGIAEVVRELMLSRRVIVSGLDTDFKGDPFGSMPELLALATEVRKLTAICTEKDCRRKAYRTQRLVNGKPARRSDPLIVIGGEEESAAKEKYTARCLRHHVVRK